MLDTSTCGETSVKRGQVGKELNTLNTNVEVLHKVLAVLEQHISPILRPAPEGVGTPQDKLALVELAEALQRQNFSLSHAIDKIREMTDRIEL